MKKLKFPHRYSIGSVYIAPANQPESWELLAIPQGLVTKPENQPINWDWLDEARGNLTIPHDTKVKLKINSSASARLNCLEEMPFDALHTLDASRTGVTDDFLSHASHLSELRVLELAYTAISDEGAAIFSRLENLHTLGLTHTAITNTGLKEIAQLTNLRELWLNGTLIDDEGMESIRELEKLVLLGLSSTRVTSEGLAEIYGLSELLRLYMFNTALDEEGAADFRKHVSKCRVKWQRPAAIRPEFVLADDASLSLEEEFDDFDEDEIITLLEKNGERLEKQRNVKPMTDDRFWQIIDLLDWDAQGNDSQVIEPAVEALAGLSDEDIFGFLEALHNKLYQLDAEKFARNIGRESYRSPSEYFSPSWFLNVRCCAVANGQELFEEIVSAPDTMPKDLGFRAVCRIAPEAYFRKTGHKLVYTPLRCVETFSNKQGWPSLLEKSS